MSGQQRFEILTACDDAAAFIAAHVLARSPVPTLVRIDGDPLAGKSTLARALAERLGGDAVSVDDCLDGLVRRGRTYPQMVMRQSLVARFAAARSPIVLEGIWLDAAAPVDEFGDGYRVYIRFRPAALIAQDVAKERRQFRMVEYERSFDFEGRADIVVTRTFDPW